MCYAVNIKAAFTMDYTPYSFTSLATQLGANAGFKTLAGVVFAVGTWLFDPLYAEALLALFILVLVDFFTGVAASRKEGQTIRSARIRETAKKLTAYFAMIAAAHISETALPAMVGILDETVTGYLVATELKSILENMGRLGYASPARVLNILNEYIGKK